MTPPKRKPAKRAVAAPKRKMVQVHVVPVARGLLGWRIKLEGRVVGQHARQEDAESVALFFARYMRPASVRLHDRAGKVKEERTFSRKDDPAKTPG